MDSLPDDFVHIQTASATGRAWLAELPSLLDELAARWSLTRHPPFVQLSYNYVAPVTLSTGDSAVLKVGPPRNELQAEMAALELVNGRGCCRLLAADPKRGAMLLERLKPGTMLATLWPDNDDEATRISAEIMHRFWQPVPPDHPFPHLRDWANGLSRLRQRYNGSTGPFPAELVDAAEAWFREQLSDSSGDRLLHGDLHHYNILRSTSAEIGWSAIDPKGVVGPPAYEVSNLLRNPFGFAEQPSMPQALRRRVDVLAEQLPFSRAEIWGWTMAQSLLSAWWNMEDLGEWDEKVVQISAECHAQLRQI